MAMKRMTLLVALAAMLALTACKGGMMAGTAQSGPSTSAGSGGY